jgi:hypothetical protein
MMKTTKFNQQSARAIMRIAKRSQAIDTMPVAMTMAK